MRILRARSRQGARGTQKPFPADAGGRFRESRCANREERPRPPATIVHPAFTAAPGASYVVIGLAWPLLRAGIYLRRGRMPPPSMPDPVWYFAYGSNMNERLFRERRHMTWHEARVGRLKDHRLAFTVAGGMRPGVSAPANIVAAPGSAVYGALYLLPLRKFARLDNSEGRQYGYWWTDVEDFAGNRLPAVTYKVPHAGAEGRPGRGYLDLIREAARQRGLPPDYIAFLDGVEARA